MGAFHMSGATYPEADLNLFYFNFFAVSSICSDTYETNIYLIMLWCSGKKEQQIDASVSRADIPRPVFCLLGLTVSFLRQKQKSISNFLTVPVNVTKMQ